MYSRSAHCNEYACLIVLAGDYLQCAQNNEALSHEYIRPKYTKQLKFRDNTVRKHKP